MMFRKLKTVSASLVFLAMCCLGLSAAEVGRVDFLQEGSRKLPDEQIRFNVQMRPGSEFSRNVLDEDTKRLYNTGNFADVVSEVDVQPDGKVNVTFRLKLRPRISKLELKGNAKLKTEELGKLMKVHQGMLLNDRDLRETLEALRKAYMERGYREATISPVIVPDGQDAVLLTILVDEKLRLKVNDVNFVGATVYSQRELRKAIANRYSYLNWIPFLNDYLNQGLFDRSELTVDKARIRDLYHDKGYLDFKITGVDVVPDPKDPEYVNITFKVEEGKPYKVSNISVSGNTKVTSEELNQMLMLAPGDTFSRAASDDICRRIIRRYETMGYADVQCRADRTENFADHTVGVKYDITEGRKYHVRDVVIVGNTSTRDKVIRRELAIQPGDPLDRNRIEVSKQRLLGMGYFSKVETTAVNADALDEKDIRVEVKENESRYQLRLGAGASDVNSVFGMAEISTNNFDLTRPQNWFYGGGQRLRLQGIYGAENAGFNLDFVEPWLFDLPLRFEASGFMNDATYDQWDERRVGFRSSLQRKFFDDFTSATIGYKFEAVRVRDVCGRLEPYVDQNNLGGTSYVSQPSITLSRDTRDSLIDPTEGYNLTFYSAISPKIFGSSYNFYRLEGKGSYYINFFDKAIVAMVGAKIGTVSNFDRNDEVPLYERYFLGGGDSLRGFEYRQVSPQYNEESIGGLTMLLTTIEISHPIWGPLRGAAFCDAGNSWRNSYSMGFSQMNIGAGYGFRLKVPIINAPLRLDLAYPVLNNTENSSKFRVHFNVGFTF